MLVKQDIFVIKPRFIAVSFIVDGAKPFSPVASHGTKEGFARDKFYNVN